MEKRIKCDCFFCGKDLTEGDGLYISSCHYCCAAFEKKDRFPQINYDVYNYFQNKEVEEIEAALYILKELRKEKITGFENE